MYHISTHDVACEFRMQVWNVLHMASWKYRTQKFAKNSPSAHHHTTLSGYIFATKACIEKQKKHIKQQYLLHMSSQYGELLSSNGWGRLASLGTLANFNGFHVFVTALTLLNGGQPNFARCSVVSWAGTIYIYIFGGSCPNGILPGQFTLHPSLAFSYIGSITAQHWSSGHQPNFAAWYKEWNYGTFAPRHFQQRVPPIFRGRPSRWA